MLHEPRIQVPQEWQMVPCFRQPTNYECGFCVLHHTETYLRVFHGDEAIVDDRAAWSKFRAQALKIDNGTMMQKAVLWAVSQELEKGPVSVECAMPFIAS
jgi:hypothetical protein